MIERIQLIRNLGKFESYTAPADADWQQLTLVYGENGVGKTTVTAVLRSLGTQDPSAISERARIGAPAAPHVVVQMAGAAGPSVFQNGAWTGPAPRVLVYDDVFVDENVCSGLRVLAGHRQNLHGVVLGSRGVALARQVESLASDISALNTEIRDSADAIPAVARAGLSVEAFVDLAPRKNAQGDVDELSRRLAAAREADQVRAQPELPSVELPSIDRAELEALLAHELAAIDACAVEAVRSHLAAVGDDGELWVAQGIEHAGGLPSLRDAVCPFCARPLRGAALVDHYRAYFSEAYARFKATIRALKERSTDAFGEARLSTVQRAILDGDRIREFWRRFTDVPASDVDVDAVLATWRKARETVDALLAAKLANPLDSRCATAEDDAALDDYEACVGAVSRANAASQRANVAIRAVKARVERQQVAELEAALQAARATVARFGDEAVRSACHRYMKVRAEKAQKDVDKTTAWTALNGYRDTVMPRYQAAVNRYLRRFGATFSIAQFAPENRGGRPSSAYAVEIRGRAVPLAAPAGGATPAFSCALSSGDRNTLALAFFFAQLETEGGIQDAIVVIDDPSSSLDDTRATVTAQEIRGLRRRVQQVVVLSHSKRLIGDIWTEERGQGTALVVRVAGNESTLARLHMAELLQEQYDRQHADLRGYLDGSFLDARQAALNLRPVIEGFLRKARNEHFGPGALLGQLIDACRRALVAGGTPILTATQLAELVALNEYASRFHHSDDAQRVRALANLNEGELRAFVRRTLDFTAPPHCA